MFNNTKMDEHHATRVEHFMGEDSENEESITPLATTEQDNGVYIGGQNTTAVTPRGEDVVPVLDASSTKAENYQIRDNSRHGANIHNYLTMEEYLTNYQHKSASRRPLGFINGGSTQSSSGSLQALFEHEGVDTTTLRRAQSTKSARSLNRGRSKSHTKTTSASQPTWKRPNHGDHFYPDQSFAQLSNSILPPRPKHALRTRSSHPAQNMLYNETAKHKLNIPQGRRTADNTPMSSPGLFTPTAIRQATADRSLSGSPHLHHLQAPKETHTAEIEHDVYSGNKFINNYEIVRELGRGEHGKVKLGRDVEKDTWAAIKIVPRYSAKRRLGKLGAPEDRTKREVAILKKARHPNVVSLLEVIDDPNKNKVYLILEFVDQGEIKWRKNGVKEILAINNIRFESERRGLYVGLEATDKDSHLVRQARIRHERLEQLGQQHKDLSHIPNWSLEYAGDTDDESELLEPSRTLSRQLTNQSISSRGNSGDDYVGMHEGCLAGSMYGAYIPDAYRVRKFSVAASAMSHMSSDFGFEQDDDQHSYVPALTLEEARRAFRDTLVGLEFLHFIGIIHRDIKPANLLSSSNGAVKISDFGVSYLGRPITEEEAENTGTDATPPDTEKELARSVGTPAFWAPELCYEDAAMFADGKDPKITGALDLWALGITLYCMIYARLPFYSNDEMGLHEAICTASVFCPASRLMPVDTTNSTHITRSNIPINGNKRLDYDLKFELVPDEVRELIGMLLTKDPANRITIAEAKRHKWVVEGLTNQNEWFSGPIEKGEKTKILEVNEKEMSHAVVKRNIIERALTTAGRLAGSLLGRKDNRKRASSSATSAASSTESLTASAAAATGSIGRAEKSREARRTSLRGDELAQALKASRETTEHPLAQSQTASPESKGQVLSYFEAPKAMSMEAERRPRGPDRAISSLSTAESIKTIRASQLASIENSERLQEHTLRSRVEGLWEGTTKSVNRLASREGRRKSRSRSAGQSASEGDGHADPSVAVSNTFAAGSMATPSILHSPEVVSGPESPSSLATAKQHLPIHAPVSSITEFENAQHINQRRYFQELQDGIDATNKEDTGLSPGPCPPSPDDVQFLHSDFSGQEAPTGGHDHRIQTAASASTIASSVDEFENSSVSVPSHGIASGASSPPEGFLSAEYKDIPHYASKKGTEPEFMRTADTVTVCGANPTAPAKALEQQHEYYDAGDDDEEEDSDEEGIIMGGSKRN